MSTIVAAIDNSAAARPVLSFAAALASILGADLEAVHVREGEEGETAIGLAASLDVPCEVLTGDALPAITACAERDDVIGIAVGARRRLQGAHVGHLARALADALAKPVLVVPPEAHRVEHLRTIVIAMEGTPAKARNVKTVLDLAASANLELTVVHVDDEDSIPSFSDQLAHETEAYTKEFLARYLHGAPAARLELRVGEPVDEILKVCESSAAQLLAVGWPHSPDAGRGVTAQELLDRSHIPMLLVATD